MKTINKLKDRKGVSPVIATVILVAVTITVAVAVAYWMSGIAGQYTQFEKVEIQGGYAIKTVADGTATPPTIDGWNIIITLKNSGTSTATLISCFLNEQIIGTTGPTGGELIAVFADALPTTAGGIGASGDLGITIASGESVEVTISPIGTGFSTSGTTVNVKLHSAGGMDYIRLVTLP